MKENNNKEKRLSDEEIEMIRSSVRVSDRRRNEERRQSAPSFRSYAKNNKLHVAVVITVALLLVVALVFASVYLIGLLLDRPNRSDYTVYFGDDSYTVKYKDAVVDGVVFIDMRRVAEFAGLTVSGSATRVKFTASEEHFLRFTDGEDVATLNGKTVVMSAAASVNADKCMIPLAFLEDAVSFGMKIKHDTDNNIIKFGRMVYEVDGGYEPTEILFSSEKLNVVENNGSDQGIKNEDFVYSVDISSYIDSIAPKNADEYLILVNKTHPIGSPDEPDDLLKLSTRTSRTLYLRRDAAEALYAMMLVMNHDVPSTADTFVTSAYRSYSYQEGLYNGYVDDFVDAGMSLEAAKIEASKFSARPGESEHQTGLCFDFMTDTMSDLDESFENTAAFDWLQDNAHKFGFVLRYPEDKTDITGYSYEPWHYRFVGREAATEMYLTGLCLEEYLGED